MARTKSVTEKLADVVTAENENIAHAGEQTALAVVANDNLGGIVIPVEFTSREEALTWSAVAYGDLVRSGWKFAIGTDNALRQFGKNTQDRVRFLEDLGMQIGLKAKTIYNMVSLARNQSALTAMDHGLDIGYGSALTKFKDPAEANSYAALAAEQQWSLADLRIAVAAAHGEQPKQTTIVNLEVEVNDNVVDMAAKVVKFVRQYFGEEGLQAIREWLAEEVA